MKLIVFAALLALASAAPRVVRPRLDGRIVGGSSTTIDRYPYQVSLQYFGSHICGGSVLNNRYILTAAHCTDGSSAASLSIRAGTSTRNSGGTVINVQTIYQNPNYNSNTVDYDISILYLSSALTFGTNIKAVGLPTLNQAVPAGSNVVVTGWGTTSEGGSAANQLQVVTVQVISNSDCNNAYGGDITARMLCAGVSGGGKDACQGDSGGPLVNTSGQQVGIVSWGIGCARPAFPGVYSSVPNLRNYITQITGL